MEEDPEDSDVISMFCDLHECELSCKCSGPSSSSSVSELSPIASAESKHKHLLTNCHLYSYYLNQLIKQSSHCSYLLYKLEIKLTYLNPTKTNIQMNRYLSDILFFYFCCSALILRYELIHNFSINQSKSIN